jgi:glycosyltransferase involved in cell wall biosynthesis
MTISIITISYNSAATIADTLQSVASQRYEKIEHIIIDGGSTDETLQIITRYPHVAKLVSEKDNGLYDAMNKGIALATGEVIGILNSDDLFADADVLQKVADAFKNPAVEACYGDLQYVQHNNLSEVIRHWKSGKFSMRKFYYGWMPPHPTFFVRHYLYAKHGVFNTRLRTAADYELMLRFLLKHQIKAIYIPYVLVKMRAGGVSNANFRNRIKANQQDREAWRINGLKPYFFTLTIKPIRKITQYIFK